MARASIMMNASPPVIEVHGDDVTVEAAYLAGRLGLPVDRLRTEMRRGIIYSVVERGVGKERAGRAEARWRESDGFGYPHAGGSRLPNRRRALRSVGQGFPND
jgi:hypothetical protein